MTGKKSGERVLCRYRNWWRAALETNQHCFQRGWTGKHMFRTQKLCPGNKNVFDLRRKQFFVSDQQNLFPQHMFPAWLNWETFASTTMFPSLTRPYLKRVLPRCARRRFKINRTYKWWTERVWILVIETKFFYLENTFSVLLSQSGLQNLLQCARRILLKLDRNTQFVLCF